MLILVFLVSIQSACSPPKQSSCGTSHYRIVTNYPHDPSAFTQGLFVHKGNLYESTGLYGQSSIRRVDIPSGQLLQVRRLPKHFFGEGIAWVSNRIYQLTWRSGTVFVYNAATFTELQRLKVQGEGWGLTYDGQDLIMSDGSDRLKYLDADTLDVKRVVSVADNGVPVKSLNELEYVNGEILANIWQTEKIARIRPSDGVVTGWINLENLLSPEERPGTDVMNGIAFDKEKGLLYITGKYWPRLFVLDWTNEDDR